MSIILPHILQTHEYELILSNIPISRTIPTFGLILLFRHVEQTNHICENKDEEDNMRILTKVLYKKITILTQEKI